MLWLRRREISVSKSISVTDGVRRRQGSRSARPAMRNVVASVDRIKHIVFDGCFELEADI